MTARWIKGSMWGVHCDAPGCGTETRLSARRHSEARARAEKKSWFVRDGQEDFCHTHAPKDEETGGAPVDIYPAAVERTISLIEALSLEYRSRRPGCHDPECSVCRGYRELDDRVIETLADLRAVLETDA